MSGESPQPDPAVNTPLENIPAIPHDAFTSTQHIMRVTARSVPPSLSRHWRPRFHVVGVLRPVAGALRSEIRITHGEVVIGRAGQASVRIFDESVSRQHARILRKVDEFLIEDLQSRNGTFVDGVPVVSCVLRGGDAVQIGRNLFYFSRLLEPTDLPPVS